MARKIFALVLILSLALTICCSGNALTPALTPTPTPTPSPTPTPVPPTPSPVPPAFTPDSSSLTRLTPTPSPTPLEPPSNKQDSCGDHIHLSVSGLRSRPEQHLLCMYEDGCFADGILMFMPLDQYVESEHIPVISRSQFLSADLSCDDYVEDFSCETRYYRKNGDKLERLRKKDLQLTDLPEGTYLIALVCSASHGDEYYSFCYLFWVE